ncbi:unnamed protein product [Prunus brigantina]
MLDHLYSTDDNLTAGGPLLLLKNARENPVVGDEPSSETAPVVDPASISRCCIEKGLFPAVPLFFQYPCGISKYVANISRLPICGDRSPFGVALTPEETDNLAVLRRGAPTSPSTSLRFSNWVQYFGDANRQGPYRLAAFIALWLGWFVFCDFSQDCLHERVFPLALAIARGDTIPLAPMFLGHLYHLLDRTQLLEKNASGTMGVETLLNSGFLQVFLWERLKGLDTFTFVPFYADVSDTVEVPAAVSQSDQFRKYALLNAAPIPLPTLGDNRAEVSVTYSPHRVRRQFRLDQGVPGSLNHGDIFALHRIFWSNDHIPASCRPIFLASKTRAGGFSRGYQAYWNRCLTSFREFQSSPGDRLPPTTARLAGLVSEEKAIPLSQKRNLPFISKSGDIVGEFPKTKPRPGVQSPDGSGKSAMPMSAYCIREPGSYWQGAGNYPSSQENGYNPKEKEE